MNRKQRRALRHRGVKPSLGANAAQSRALAQLYEEAAACHRVGAFAEAERRYQQILTQFPAHAQTHRMLGATLMAQGKTSEAISHFEYVITLKPDLADAYQDLGRACHAVGQLKSAIGAARRALELDETPQSKTLFAQCVKEARFTADDGRIRNVMLRALSEAWDRPRDLAGTCISLIKLNGVLSDSIERANSAWPERLSVTDLLGGTLRALARDQVLCRLLECTPITDVGLERLLANMRLAMLTTATNNDECDESLLGFCCALARQCFINQYVFSMTEAEAEQARCLRLSLEKTLAAGDLCPPLWPVIVGAYFPLHTLSDAETLLDRSWPTSVAALLIQQVKEPADERRIAAKIPRLTHIDGEVSRAVRQQYEESPYPRWVKAGPPGEPIVLRGRPPDEVLEVLIAGCGTGLSTVEFARQTPRARVLAVDLSLASLCYAKRMAQSYGLTNVEFGQADITKLATIGREFDYIDASGVLHHLADLWEGWRGLLSLLLPGGVMQIGLYSQLARKSVAATRGLIAERGYRPIPEDIRCCREDVLTADNGSLLRSVIQWNDFFATDECRDLLFHVQEHRITLHEIKSFLITNGMQFGGFILDARTLHRFAMLFREQAAMTDLDRWQDFETQAPGTFAAMYQFWVRKPSAHTGNTMAGRG